MVTIDNNVGIETTCPVERIFFDCDGQKRLEGIGFDCDPDNRTLVYAMVCIEYINEFGVRKEVKGNKDG